MKILRDDETIDKKKTKIDFRNKRNIVRYNKIQYKVKSQEQNLPSVDQYTSRIPKMYCMKSQQIGRGRAVLTSTANSGRFAKIGQNRQWQLARPFHALFPRISCNTFLESLKHTYQPWVVFVSGALSKMASACCDLLLLIIS